MYRYTSALKGDDDGLLDDDIRAELPHDRHALLVSSQGTGSMQSMCCSSYITNN